MLSLRRLATHEECSPPFDLSPPPSPHSTSSCISTNSKHRASSSIFNMSNGVIILPEPQDDQEELMKLPKSHRRMLWKPFVTLGILLMVVCLAPPSAPSPRHASPDMVRRRTQPQGRRRGPRVKGKRGMTSVLRDVPLPPNNHNILLVVDARSGTPDSTTADKSLSSLRTLRKELVQTLGSSVVCTSTIAETQALDSTTATTIIRTRQSSNQKATVSTRHARGLLRGSKSISHRFAHCPPSTQYWVDFQQQRTPLQPESILAMYPNIANLRVVLLVPDSWVNRVIQSSSFADGTSVNGIPRLEGMKHYLPPLHSQRDASNVALECWFQVVPPSNILLIAASEVEKRNSPALWVKRVAKFLQIPRSG